MSWFALFLLLNLQEDFFQRNYLKNIISLYENIACCHGIFPEAKVIGVSLNTSNLDSVSAKKMIDFWESETKLPVSDVVRYGPKKLGDAIKNF